MSGYFVVAQCAYAMRGTQQSAGIPGQLRPLYVCTEDTCCIYLVCKTWFRKSVVICLVLVNVWCKKTTLIFCRSRKCPRQASVVHPWHFCSWRRRHKNINMLDFTHHDVPCNGFYSVSRLRLNQSRCLTSSLTRCWRHQPGAKRSNCRT